MKDIFRKLILGTAFTMLFSGCAGQSSPQNTSNPEQAQENSTATQINGAMRISDGNIQYQGEDGTWTVTEGKIEFPKKNIKKYS